MIKSVEHFINISSIIIVSYLCLSMSFTFYKDIKRRIMRPKDEINNKSADIAGIYMFMHSVVSNLDLIILVFVSQYLCKDMDPATSTAMACIPLSVCSAGQWIGTFMATPISKILGEKKSGYIFTLFSIITILLIVLSLKAGIFALYVIGKFFFGLFIKGGLYVLGDTIPFGATSEEVKVNAVNSTRQATYSASILTILISGYISQCISYSATYLIGALVIFFMLILVPLFFPINSKHISLTKTMDKKRSLGWSMWLMPSMLIFIIFFMIPRSVMLGYESYLFPLYTSNSGISTLVITNINVFAKTAAYILGNSINKFTKNRSRLSILGGSQLSIAITFALFFIFPNVYWAMFVLFISAICDRMTQAVATLYVNDIAIKNGYDEKQEVSNYYSVNSATYCLQSPVLSAFLNLGYNMAATTVGIICWLMLSIFSIFNIKSKNEKSN